MPKFNILPERNEVENPSSAVGLGRFPSWLHRPLPKGGELFKTSKVLGDKQLHTVCEEAKCPNLLECWSKKTATFLVMGKECTRACGFCDIDHAKAPLPLELDEPVRVADSVVTLGLEHVVITMVARDDLEDGGANHIKLVTEEIRKVAPKTTIEILTSDLEGNEKALDIIIEARPDIFNHNIETVERLTPRVRHKATYRRTLKVLSYMKPYLRYIKSGLMVGLGETQDEVEKTLNDLYQVGVEIVTMGQYLQPNARKLRVKSFVHPDTFNSYKQLGNDIGIPHMYCGPFVRSSYNAKDVFQWTKSR
ncbi:lipoyl synthase [Chlamydiales bacterium]|nr:lipoyl synthase [Chlamydiales bacterium]